MDPFRSLMVMHICTRKTPHNNLLPVMVSVTAHSTNSDMAVVAPTALCNTSPAVTDVDVVQSLLSASVSKTFISSFHLDMRGRQPSYLSGGNRGM